MESPRTLVLVPSVIIPTDNPLSYTPTRSIYTSEDRLHQTVKTLQTVREKIPGAHLVVLECSDLPVYYVKVLIEQCDQFVNYNSNPGVREAVCNSPFKGYGEVRALLEYLMEEISDDLPYDAIFKISGRYCLNDNFDLTVFTPGRNCIHVHHDHGIGATTLYKMRSKDEFVDALTASVPELLQGKGIEQVFFRKVKDYLDVPTLGVEGYVSVSGDFYQA